MRHRLSGLYAFVALIYLVPLWAVDRVPTTDGPSHLYNASVLRHLALGTEDHPLYAEYYEIDRRPLPNWSTHAALAVLLGVASPATAEKLLASAIVLTFLAGAWVLVGAVLPERRDEGNWPAFLAFPFVYHQLFQWGFYNFALGMGLYLLAVGLWWRYRERPGWGFAVALNAILLLAWFTHLLPFGLALVTIGVLWLAALPRADLRRHVLYVAFLAPQAALPLWWFLTSAPGGIVPEVWGFRRSLGYLIELGVLHTFDPIQLRVGAALVGLFALLAAFGLWRAVRSRSFPRAEDVFLLLAALFAAAYLLAPHGFSGGTMLKQRLSLFPFLLLLPWLSARLGGAGGRRAAGLAALALANAAFLTGWYRTLDREVEAYLAGLSGAPPDSRGLSLLFDRQGSASNTDIYGHAFDHVALEKGILDWGNYEARSAVFPVRFRPGVEPTPLYVQEARPFDFPVGEYRRIVDFIYTWRMPEDAPIARRIERSYRLASGTEGGGIWVRKRHGRRARRGE